MAKSSERGGWVTSWTSLEARKYRVTAAVCALALSWWSSRPRTPVWGRRLHHVWKTIGNQWLTYQSAVTVFMSSSGMVAAWSNFAKKHAIICLEALLFLLNFTGGLLSGKTHIADCYFVSGRIGIRRFCLLLRCPRHKKTFLRQIFSVCGCTSPPYPLLLFTQVMGHPTPRQPWQMQGRLPDEIFMIFCISAYVIFGSFLIRDSTLETFSGVTVVAIRSQRSSSASVLAPDMNCLNHLKTVGSSSRHELSEPPENSGFGQRLISKTVL